MVVPALFAKNGDGLQGEREFKAFPSHTNELLRTFSLGINMLKISQDKRCLVVLCLA